jgi:UDP-glucose 4-epimerase
MNAAPVVLVTGANGYIGRHMARYWSGKGYRVVGLGHGGWEPADAKAWGVARWIQASVSLSALVGLGEKPSLVCHAAGSGSVGFSMEHPREDFEKTVASIAEVLEFARKVGPEVSVVYPSSASVYGQARTLPIVESSETESLSVYGVHKRMAEGLCLSYTRHFGVPVAIVRLFSVYGTGLRKQLLWDSCVKAASGQSSFWGTGDETRDWIHVEDAVDLLDRACRAATVDTPVLVNGASGSPVAVRSVVKQIFKRFGLDVRPVFNGKQRVGDPRDYWASLDRARALGWSPRKDFETGLSDYVDWFRALPDDR